MGTFIDLTNTRFGRLTVLSKHGYSDYNRITWLCKCDCGNTTIVTGNLLRQNKTKLCGCLFTESHITHNMTGTKIYYIWKNMNSRCNINNEYYGGRGIKVCNRWKKFELFYEDFGHTYPGNDLTIDRINVNGDYEIGNVKWATMKEQSLNKRTTKLDQTKIDKIRELAVNTSYAEIGRLFDIDPSHARKVAINERC